MNVFMLVSNDIGGVTSHMIIVSEKLMTIDKNVKVVIGCELGKRTEGVKSKLITYVLNFPSKNPFKILEIII